MDHMTVSRDLLQETEMLCSRTRVIRESIGHLYGQAPGKASTKCLVISIFDPWHASYYGQ